MAGWHTVTGEPVIGARVRGVPLSARGAGPGQSCHYVGGGDNPNVVPTTPTLHHTRKPKPTGFSWPEYPDQPAGVPPTVLHSPNPRVYGPKAGRRKLDHTARVEIASRYLDGGSSVALAEDYDVDPRTIRKALKEMGVAIRTAHESNLLRQARRVASGWVDPKSQEVA
jgi:hypothetical protein